MKRLEDLETENEALRIEVAELRAMLIEELVFPGFTPQETLLLNHLLKVKVATTKNVTQLLVRPMSTAKRNMTNIARVNFSNVRKKLHKQHAIDLIKPTPGTYGLRDEDKVRVRALAA